jgi:cilia- and flagella-associated protein 300
LPHRGNANSDGFFTVPHSIQQRFKQCNDCSTLFCCCTASTSQVFKAVTLGGSMCQPDATLDGYLDVTKSIYKDLVAVHKQADTGDIVVGSEAYLITAFDSSSSSSSSGTLFSTDSTHNVCIVVISAAKQQVAVLHKTFKSFW